MSFAFQLAFTEAETKYINLQIPRIPDLVTIVSSHFCYKIPYL